MRHRRLFIATVVFGTLIAREARGDEIWRVKSPSTLKTEKGSEITLPPGYFLDEEAWQERDLEMRRLQEIETRLKAENKSLRESADFPPWGYVLVGVVGVALGATAAILK